MLVFHSTFSPALRDRPGIKCFSKSFNTVELISMCTQMTWRFPAQLIHPTGQTRKKEALCLSADLNTISRTKTLVWSTGPEVNKVIRITIILSVMDDHYNQFCTVVSWTRMKGNLVYHNRGERSRLTALQSLPNELKWFQLICPSKYIQKTWQLLFPPLVSALKYLYFFNISSNIYKWQKLRACLFESLFRILKGLNIRFFPHQKLHLDFGYLLF